MEMTITQAINIAKRMTKEVAELKDYRVRNKALKAARENARELLSGRGYVIKNGKIYGYRYNSTWKSIELAAVR